MKFFQIFLFFILFSCLCSAQDINTVIIEGDRLEAVPDEKAAFLKFREALKIQPTNLYALTKCSELCSRIGGREKHNEKLRDEYYATAIIYAKNALKLYPNNDEANVTMAIAVGKTILLKSGRERISAVKQLKEYAEKAISENPNNFKAWHILGRWNYEVSNLNVFERAGAKIMYGGLPNASLKMSIKCYEKAKALSPAFAYNYLELAKAYNRNEEKAKAIAQLKMLLTLRNQSEDDPRIKTEAAALLKSWS